MAYQTIYPEYSAPIATWAQEIKGVARPEGRVLAYNAAKLIATEHHRPLPAPRA